MDKKTMRFKDEIYGKVCKNLWAYHSKSPDADKFTIGVIYRIVSVTFDELEQEFKDYERNKKKKSK